MDVGVKRTGDWAKMRSTMRNLMIKSNSIIEESLKSEAEKSAVAVRANIDSGGRLGGAKWKELSPLTLAMHPNAKPLLGKSGEVRDAVQAFKIRKGSYMVGIKRGARGQAGGDLSLIGSVHENGAQLAISWTPQRLRAFWALVGKTVGRERPYTRKAKGASGSGSTAVQIPARPFLKPMLAKMRSTTYGLKGRVQQHFMRRIVGLR